MNVLRGAGLSFLGLCCFGTHGVGFALEAFVVVDCHAVDFGIGGNAAFALLDDVCCLVGKVLLLTGAEVDVVALRIGEGADFLGGRGVVVDVDVAEVMPSGGCKAFYEVGGEATCAATASFELGRVSVGGCLELESGSGTAAGAVLETGAFECV